MDICEAISGCLPIFIGFALVGCGDGTAIASATTTARNSASEDVVASSRSGSETIKAFTKRCDQATVVMGYNPKGDVAETGEAIDDFCAGYLEGTFHAMERAAVICTQDPASGGDPYFLRSVVRKYVSDTSGSGKDRDSVVWLAFSRAFNCPKQ